MLINLAGPGRLQQVWLHCRKWTELGMRPCLNRTANTGTQDSPAQHQLSIQNKYTGLWLWLVSSIFLAMSRLCPGRPPRCERAAAAHIWWRLRAVAAESLRTPRPCLAVFCEGDTDPQRRPDLPGASSSSSSSNAPHRTPPPSQASNKQHPLTGLHGKHCEILKIDWRDIWE